MSASKFSTVKTRRLRLKPARIAGRSPEFQAHLDNLDAATVARIEAAEAAYLPGLAHRLAHAEHLFTDQMLGVEEPPAGRRYV